MEKLPRIREHMDRHVPTLRQETDILEAVSFLLRKKVTGAPVVDASGQLVGIVTEKDCLKLVAAGIEGNLPRGPVSTFMTPDPLTISPDMDVYYAAGVFVKNDFRRLLVVEDGRLVGAITRFDILRVIQVHLGSAV